MKVLILGNGFDIAHGLPTQYKDFLNFADSVLLMYYEENPHRSINSISIEGYENHLDRWIDDKPAITEPAIIHIKERLRSLFQKRNVSPLECSNPDNPVYKVHVEPILDKFYSYLKYNVRYKYIAKIYATNQACGQNWIDFESEISTIIQAIDEEHTSLTQDVQNDLFRLLEKNPHGAGRAKIDIFIKAAIEAYRGYKMGMISDFRERLFSDLEKLILALEIYLVDFVETLDIQSLSEITNIRPDLIISFNYTKTYERLYLKDEHSYKVCHIHGVCRELQELQDKNNDKSHSGYSGYNSSYSSNYSSNYKNRDNNMVLGIDEYLLENQQTQKTDFSIFKKFVQRIRNHNNTNYISWYNEIEQNFKTEHRGNSQVYIYGHSLDVTDKDILKRFIDSPYTEVRIYAHSKGTEGELISHLLRYIKEETVIRKASMNPPMLEFKVTAEKTPTLPAHSAHLARPPKPLTSSTPTTPPEHITEIVDTHTHIGVPT